MNRNHTTESAPPSAAATAPSNDRSQLWGVVLAAGEGTRLAEVTRRLYGREMPKQFAALSGEQSLLQQTVARLAPMIPAHRMVVVVARDRRELAEGQLRHAAGIQIVSQPENSGTGPGVYLPLSFIKARAPEATVVVTPCDHHVAAPSILLEAIAEAVRACHRAPGSLALIGAEADSAATDLGWIIPDAAATADEPSRVARVRAFVEKPKAELAAELLEEGGLWNTLIMVGSVASFWRQGEEHLPRQISLFEELLAALRSDSDAAGPAAPVSPSRATEQLLGRLYKRMPPADFSRAVLQNARRLAVVPMRGAGWSDCGTPDRLLGCLGEANDRRDQVLKAILRTLSAEQTLRSSGAPGDRGMMR